MPRFDGTGPTGQGPMTGGGFGYCTSENTQNINVPFYRRGRQRRFFNARGGGMGRGFGSGRGFRNRFYAGYGGYSQETENIPVTNEKQYLESELEFLEKEVNSIKKRLETIDHDKNN